MPEHDEALRPDRCETCRFWQGFPELQEDSGERISGCCHRFPPKLIPMADCADIDRDSSCPPRWEFPATYDVAWCGEWQPRAEDPGHACPDRAAVQTAWAVLKTALALQTAPPRQYHSPILPWAAVPAQARARSLRPSLFPEERRCTAATRPWQQNKGPRGEYNHCPFEVRRDGLCAVHAPIADAIGSVTWEEEHAPP